MKNQFKIKDQELPFNTFLLNLSILDPIENIISDEKELQLLANFNNKIIADFLSFDPMFLISRGNTSQNRINRIMKLQYDLLDLFSHTKLVTRIMELKNTAALNLEKITYRHATDLLSTRAQNCINKLKISSIDEILTIDKNDIIHNPGTGLKTWFEIQVLKDIINMEYDLLNVNNNKESFINNIVKENESSTSLKKINHYTQFIPNRTKNALTKLKIRNLKDLLKLRDYDFNRVVGVGEKTKREIYALIKKIIEDEKLGAIGFDDPLIESIKSPITKDNLYKLPLFSNSDSYFSIEDFHESYKMITRVEMLIVPVRVQNVLNSIGIKTIGQLLITKRDILIAQNNFGRTSLEDIQIALKEYLLGESGKSSSEIDYSSFHRLIVSFINKCIKKERNREILLMRITTRGGKTYHTIGRHFNLTRERIRQILNNISKTLEKKAILENLNHLWYIINAELRLRRIVNIDKLALLLMERLTWKEKPDLIQLRWLLSLNSEYIYDEEKEVIYNLKCPCIECNQIYEKLFEIVKSKNDKVLISAIVNTLATYCKIRCTINSVESEGFDSDFIKYLVTSKSHLAIEDEYVMSHRQWLYQFGNKRSEVLRVTIEKIGRPMHYSELAKNIRNNNKTFEDISDQSIHSLLINSDDFIFIGRGVYGLKKWNLKRHKTVGNAIIDLLKERQQPIKAETIIEIIAQKGNYSINNIKNTLKNHPKICAVGHDLYFINKKVKATKEVKIKKQISVETGGIKLNKKIAAEIQLSDVQWDFIQYFLDSRGKLTQLKIEIFSRKNKLKGNQIINSLNQYFINKYKISLINQESYYFMLNDYFIEREI